MELYSIASGSSGNCIMIGDDNNRVLIDAGISKKRIKEGLNAVGLDPSDCDAMFITHEHWDHTAGIGVMARGYGLPIYGTKGTLKGVKRQRSLGNIDSGLYKEIAVGDEVSFGNLTIKSFRISHDAAEPCMYVATSGNKKCAVVTDLGFYNEDIINELKGVNAILVEANHDVNMLMTGPYPYDLKKRILSEYGHLSNETGGQLLSSLLHDDFHTAILGHLSAENNYDKLALETVKLEVTNSNTPYKADDFPIVVARRSEPISMVRF